MAWVHWGPLFPLTEPINGDFSWVNQGGASVSVTNGGIYLLGPAAAGNNLRIRKKAAPATPYTITAAFIANQMRVQYPAWGLVFRESASGKLATFGCAVGLTPTTSVHAQKYTNETTWSALYLNAGLLETFSEGLMFWRIADDGVNRILSWSSDGIRFNPVHTVARADFLVADEVGFFVNAANAANPIGLQLLSWKEA